MLSGRDHLVHTGVTVSVPSTGARRASSILVTTRVTFADLDAMEQSTGTSRRVRPPTNGRTRPAVMAFRVQQRASSNESTEVSPT